MSKLKRYENFENLKADITYLRLGLTHLSSEEIMVLGDNILSKYDKIPTSDEFLLRFLFIITGAMYDLSSLSGKSLLRYTKDPQGSCCLI